MCKELDRVIAVVIVRMTVITILVMFPLQRLMSQSSYQEGREEELQAKR